MDRLPQPSDRREIKENVGALDLTLPQKPEKTDTTERQRLCSTLEPDMERVLKKDISGFLGEAEQLKQEILEILSSGLATMRGLETNERTRHVLAGRIVGTTPTLLEVLYRDAEEAREKALRSLREPPPHTVTGPLISAIIPTFNEARFLQDTLRSLRNQTYNNVEMIVADYNSTDATREIATAMGAKVIGVPRKGIALARNMGARHA